jgi:broad specificity phosphatase PhoE
MTRVLRSVVWGEPALSLLSHCGALEDGVPAVMHFRHTERHLIEGIGTGRSTLTTPTGKRAAHELGASLPTDRRYRLFHTHYERTRETALEIHESLVEKGVASVVVGDMRLSTILDQEEYDSMLSGFSDTEAHAAGFFGRWTSGLFPPRVLRPSLEFARRGAEITMAGLRSAGADEFHVYVSHDTWVAAFMLHWFGLSPHPDWVKFLDGFIVQFGDAGMSVSFRDRRLGIDYPEWWGPKLPRRA